MENAASYSSFAEQLRSFRKRRRLTQQGVAEQLNVTRGTIVGWEGNRTHPQSKGLVLDLAKVLRPGCCSERCGLQRTSPGCPIVNLALVGVASTSV